MRRFLVKPALAAWMGLFVSLLFTAGAFQLARRKVDLERRSRFDVQAEEVRRTIALQAQSYASALIQARGFFAANREVTREEFAAYVRNMDLESRYPGMRAAGFLRRVRKSELAQHVLAVRAEGFPDYRVFPPPAADAFPVVFAEPLDAQGQRGLGYDMWSEPVRRQAMLRACETGAPGASGPITLIQDRFEGGTQIGFLMFVPVFEAGQLPQSQPGSCGAAGFLYGSFRAEDLFRALFAKRTVARAISFDVTDRASGALETLLFRNGPPPAPGPHVRLATLDVGGRSWMVRLAASPTFYAETRSREPWIVLFAGLATSALVFQLLLAKHRHATSERRLLEGAQEARVAAERAARTRDDLLAIVSHDLKNPVTSILENARQIERLPPEALGDRARRPLSGIQNAAEGMRLLLGDLADLARIDSGRLVVERKRVELGPLLADAVELLQPIAAEKGVRLAVQLPEGAPRVLCDHDRILQVFSNLIGNAIEFSPAGGVVAVRAEPSRGEVRLSVADTGPGIKPGELAQVFERLSDARGRSATGLGLFIVKGIVEAHEGRVWVESPRGKGATFNFTLPLAEDA